MATGSSSPFLLLIIIFDFAISTHAASPPEEVRDTTGKVVRAGTDYYILPLFHGKGSGLTLGTNRNQTCPLDVLLERHGVYNGLPLKFRPANSKMGVVLVSTDLNIQFSTVTRCTEIALWKIAAYDEEVEQYFVTTGGRRGYPGSRTLENWFKIEKLDDDYKLSYCPSVCRHCEVICKNIGIYVDETGVRRLALSDKPFKVMFKKV